MLARGFRYQPVAETGNNPIIPAIGACGEVIAAQARRLERMLHPFQRDQLLGASPDPDPDLLELRRQLERVMETLSQRERLVLRLRCGWDGREPMHLRVIGKRLRRTAEAVRQIELKAIRKLRHRVPAELLELLHP